VKILFLDQFSELGGAQQALLDTLQAVDHRGWEAHVLIPRSGPLWDELCSRGVPAGEIPCGPYHSGNKSAADVWRFAFDLGRQARVISDLTGRGDIDLIYVNGPRLLPAVALATRGHARVLFHAHSHVRQKSAALLAGWSVRRTAASVVGCSQSVLEPLQGHAAADRMHVIPNGVRDIGYRHRTFGHDGNWRIGVIGRIAPEKGQAEFVRAAALLEHQLPGAEFVICGAPLFGTSNRYRDAVHSAARALPVRFVGWQPDVGGILQELDLLVVPSNQEGMGRIIVEAFSAGVPVVAVPSGGVPEVVADGETGFLTREGSPEALAERIREAAETGQDELKRVALNARRAWQRSYTAAVYQERIIRLLEHLASLAPAERETEALPQRR
jgi:glycosyltransferase involved in cell wall biosynthesis